MKAGSPFLNSPKLEPGTPGYLPTPGSPLRVGLRQASPGPCRRLPIFSRTLSFLLGLYGILDMSRYFDYVFAGDW